MAPCSPPTAPDRSSVLLAPATSSPPLCGPRQLPRSRRLTPDRMSIDGNETPGGEEARGEHLSRWNEGFVPACRLHLIGAGHLPCYRLSEQGLFEV